MHFLTNLADVVQLVNEAMGLEGEHNILRYWIWGGGWGWRTGWRLLDNRVGPEEKLIGESLHKALIFYIFFLNLKLMGGHGPHGL